jgi:hypothetical protein
MRKFDEEPLRPIQPMKKRLPMPLLGRALDLWDAGFDTMEIAHALAVSEAEVYNRFAGLGAHRPGGEGSG